MQRKPKALSGGQRQRVAMGRAIVREPKAFLMDEPLSNLDAKLRVQMRTEIARIQHELNVTTIYVTHDQVEAMTMGDRVAVIRKGKLQQVDTPQRLYDHPREPLRGRLHRLARHEHGGGHALHVERRGDRGVRWAAAVGAARGRGLASPAWRDSKGRPSSWGCGPKTSRMRRSSPRHPRIAGSSTTVDLRESLGADVVAHFTVTRRR